MPRVMLIGLGQVAQFDRNVKDTPQNHAAAILEQPDFQLGALVDRSEEALCRAKERFSAITEDRFFTSVDDAPSDCDVIVIATPPEHRLAVVKQALAKHPKIIVLEKPICLTLRDAEDLRQLAAGSDTTFIVNFRRRHDRRYIKLKGDLQEHDPAHIIMRYSKGLHNYASHHLDFLISWYGKIRQVAAHPTNAKNPSFSLSMESGTPVTVIGVDGTHYDQFEVSLLLPHKAVHIENGGCEMFVQESQDGLYYPGYRQLQNRQTIGAVEPVAGFSGLYKDIATFLDKGEAADWSTLDDAFHGMQVIEAVSRSRERGGQVEEVQHG